MSHLKDFIQQTRWMFPWWHIKVISLTPDLRLITSLTPAIEASLFFSNCQWSRTVRQHHGSSLHPLLHLPVCPSIPPRWLRRESSSDPWQLSPRGAWIICQSDSKRLSGTSSALPLQLNRVPSPSDTSCLLPALKKKRYWSSLTDRLWWWRWQHVSNIFEFRPAGLSHESAVSTYDTSSVVCYPPTSASSAVLAPCCRFSRDFSR